MHKQKPNETPDTYLGSGKIIMRSIAKYGKQAHKKTILFLCHTKEEAEQLERYCIAVARFVITQDPNYKLMNIADGGNGGNLFASNPFLKEKYLKANKNKIFINNGIKNSLMLPNVPVPEGWELGMLRKEFKSNKGHRFQFITDGVIYKQLPVNVPIPAGFCKGDLRSKKYINNGIENKSIPVWETPPAGWVFGFLDTRQIKGFYITDGITTKRVLQETIIPAGWVKTKAPVRLLRTRKK
jgi:hypothetical protein